MPTAMGIVERASAFGIRASVWEKPGRLRVYAKTDRRDMKVYLELEGTAEEVEGGTFKIFCNTPQHPNWVKSQVERYRQEYIGLWHAYVVEQYDGSDLWGYGPGILGMVNESREFAAQHAADEAEAAAA